MNPFTTTKMTVPVIDPEEEIRIRCLESAVKYLAIGRTMPVSEASVINAATEFYEWVTQGRQEEDEDE